MAENILTPRLDWIIPQQTAHRHTILTADPRKVDEQRQIVRPDSKDPNYLRWKTLCEVLKRTGARVVECEPIAPYARRVFTRDPLVHLGSKILCGRFTYGQKTADDYPPGGKLDAEKRFKQEQNALIKALEHSESHPDYLMKKIVWMNENLHGGNVIVDKYAQRIFMGYTPIHGEMDEETQTAMMTLKHNSAFRIIPVAVQHGTDFYHLDTFFGFDEFTHQAYLYPDATSPVSCDRLKKELGDDLHLISKTEAENMVTNFLCVGKYIILTNDDKEFEERLAHMRDQDSIITPHKCGVDSFQIHNGGVRCATNMVDLPDLNRSKSAKIA